MTTRIESIRKMLADSPKDVFLHYSLGMELASAGQYAKAVAEFQRCTELDQAYLAARVEAGKCLRSAGRLVEAREAFAACLELAASQGETHTRDFVRQQLESLPADPA